MAKKVEVKFEANTIGFQQGVETIERKMDSLRNKAGWVGSALGGAFAVLGVGNAVGNQFGRADNVIRAAESSGVNPQDLQRVAVAGRIDEEAAGDILATLGEGIALAKNEADPTKTRALLRAGLSPDDIGAFSSIEALRRLGDTVSATNMGSNDLEQLLQDLSLGDQSRFLKPLLRGNTGGLLADASPFIDSNETLETLSSARRVAELEQRRVEKAAAGATAALLNAEVSTDRNSAFFMAPSGFGTHEIASTVDPEKVALNRARRERREQSLARLENLGSNPNTGQNLLTSNPEEIAKLMNDPATNEAMRQTLDKILQEIRSVPLLLRENSMVIEQQ